MSFAVLGDEQWLIGIALDQRPCDCVPAPHHQKCWRCKKGNAPCDSLPAEMFASRFRVLCRAKERVQQENDLPAEDREAGLEEYSR